MRGFWGYPGAEPFGRHVDGTGVAGMVLMIILWAAVIALIVIGIRALILHSRRSKAASTSMVTPGAAVAAPLPPAPVGAGPASLLAILEERYARGEIDRDEFLQRKQDLGLSGPTAFPVAPPGPEVSGPTECTA
jgi:uncharacterized membrane protein